MNALFAMEAKYFVLGLRCVRSVCGSICGCGLAPLLNAGVVGRFKRLTQAFDRHIVEIKTIRASGFQCFDAQLGLRDPGQQCVGLAHVMTCVGMEDVSMNTLFGSKVKRSLRGLKNRQVRYGFGKRRARS